MARNGDLCSTIMKTLDAQIEDEKGAIDAYSILRADIESSVMPSDVRQLMSVTIYTIITDEAKHKIALERLKERAMNLCR